MKSSIVKQTLSDGKLVCLYDDGATLYFDNMGRLTEWEGVRKFTELNLSPDDAGATYKDFISCWETHEDPMHRPVESHHIIPLYALKGSRGIDRTSALRNSIADTGKCIGLPVLAHMRAHFYLASHYRDTPAYPDAKTSFDLLSGRQGNGISDDAIVELYRMKEILRGYRYGTAERQAITSFYYQKFTDEDFAGKDLAGTSFHGCIFVGCDFSGCSLKRCDLTFTLFRNCNLDTAILDGADTRGMRVR